MQQTIKSPEIKEFPLFEGQQTYERITDQITSIPMERHPMAWTIMFGLGLIGAFALLMALVYLVAVGTGIWGINQPVAWGFAIINFVWWIGIGHAGTLISAILLLLRQAWRMSINRFAEAMTIFAVMCAGIFPLFHTGRPWVAYWLFPIPNWLAMWPQFRSPLEWDVWAVSTYFTVSVLFWYMGLIPDLAKMRDRAKSQLSRALNGVLRSAGATRRFTGCAGSRRTCCWQDSPPRWCYQSTPSCRSTSRFPSCQAGMSRYSRRTSSRAQSSRASRWC
jgi:hypothetical protein